MKKEEKNDGIAFMVTITSDTMTLAAGQTMVWEEVVTNAGGSYQPGSGEFVCPDDALYFFSVNSVTPSKTCLFRKLLKNIRFEI